MAEPLLLPGQPEASRLLESAATAPCHAYLLHGPAGAGVDGAGQWLAARLLETDEARVGREAHPDLVVVDPDGEAIRIEQVHELRRDLALRPFQAARRVYRVREADTLNQDAANALLKSLEEPPPYAVFVLESGRPDRILPTIRSRCQPVRLRPLAADVVADALVRDGVAADVARDVARIAGGDLHRARRLATEPAERDARETLLDGVIAVLDGRARPVDVRRRVASDAVEAGNRAAEEVASAGQDAMAGLGEDRIARRERARLERHYEALAKRRRRRAETDAYRDALDAAALWGRDVLRAAVGADDLVVSSARLADARRQAERIGAEGAERVVLEATATRTAIAQPVVLEVAFEAFLHQIATLAP